MKFTKIIKANNDKKFKIKNILDKIDNNLMKAYYLVQETLEKTEKDLEELFGEDTFIEIDMEGPDYQDLCNYINKTKSAYEKFVQNLIDYKK